MLPVTLGKIGMNRLGFGMLKNHYALKSLS